MATYPGRDSDLKPVSNNKYHCRVHTRMPCGANISAIATKPHAQKARDDAEASYKVKTAKHIKTCKKGCANL